MSLEFVEATTSSFKFNIHDRVVIKELNWTGRVLTIWITEKGTQYQVRYCTNGKFECEYFYEDELETK